MQLLQPLSHVQQHKERGRKVGLHARAPLVQALAAFATMMKGGKT